MHNTKTSLTQVTDIAKLLKNFVVLVMVWSLTAAPQMTLAQNATPAKAKQGPARPAAERESENRGAPHEGIKVHGHWIIDVKTPDGKLVSHHEFENSLQDGGRKLLTLALARKLSLGTWDIVLSTNATCGDAGGCVIYEQSYCSICNGNDLTLELLPDSTSPTQLKLSGTLKFELADNIHQVLTNYSGAQFFNFTGTSLATPINVAAGQIVQVTVLISFS